MRPARQAPPAHLAMCLCCRQHEGGRAGRQLLACKLGTAPDPAQGGRRPGAGAAAAQGLPARQRPHACIWRRRAHAGQALAPRHAVREVLHAQRAPPSAGVGLRGAGRSSSARLTRTRAGVCAATALQQCSPAAQQRRLEPLNAPAALLVQPAPRTPSSLSRAALLRVQRFLCSTA